MSRVLLITCPARTNGFTGGVQLSAETTGVVRVTIDDSSTWQWVNPQNIAQTIPEPAQGLPPQSNTKGNAMSTKIAFPAPGETTHVVSTEITANGSQTFEFTVPPGTTAKGDISYDAAPGNTKVRQFMQTVNNAAGAILHKQGDSIGFTVDGNAESAPNARTLNFAAGTYTVMVAPAHGAVPAGVNAEVNWFIRLH